METFIHLEKENCALGLPQSKANPSTSVLFAKGSLHLRNAKSFNVPKPQALRKALGNLNKHVPSRKPAPAKVQARKRDNLVPQTEKYPEIETFIPYNPLDYETFDVPEEHKLSDRCLAGMQLYVSMDYAKRFDALTNSLLAPMENEQINYDSFETFMPSFEEINVDLPLMSAF